MRLSCDESGAVLVEYALVLALLSLAFMAGMVLIGNSAYQALSGPKGLQSELLHYGLRDGQ